MTFYKIVKVKPTKKNQPSGFGNFPYKFQPLKTKKILKIKHGTRKYTNFIPPAVIKFNIKI